MAAIANYVLLATAHADHAATLAACTAAAVEGWPENEPGIRTSNDAAQVLVKVPAGFSIAGAGVLALHDIPPRDLLAGENWQPEPDGGP